MKDELSITIPGRPVPLARARLGKGHRFYVSHEQTAWRETIATYISAAAQRAKIKRHWEGPIELHVTFDYGAKETQLTLYKLDENENFKASRADIDNLLKMILEGLQDSGIVADDSQVASVVARKIK